MPLSKTQYKYIMQLVIYMQVFVQQVTDDRNCCCSGSVLV